MILKLATRNIWRNRQRTLITASSVAFGVWLAVFFVGTREHTYQRLIDASSKMGVGHIAVTPPDFFDLPSPSKRLSNSKEIIDSVENIKGIKAVLPRITGTAVVATSVKSTGVSYIGIDPMVEKPEFNVFTASIVKGKNLDSTTGYDALIGDDFARRLNLSLGEKFVYTASDSQGQVISQLARVKGVFHVGSSELDGHVLVLPIDMIRKTLGYKYNEISIVSIYTKDVKKSLPLRDLIHAKLNHKGDTVHWTESQPDLADYIRMDNAINKMLVLFVGIIITTGILCTMMMSIFERRRELGVLLAIGLSPIKVFATILCETFAIAIIGIISGTISIIPVYLYLYRVGVDLRSVIGETIEAGGISIEFIIKCQLSWQNALLIVMSLIILTVFAAIYPATKAALTIPQEAMKDI